MKGIKITYTIDSDNMTDAEYEDQKEKEVELTLEQLKPYIERLLPLNAGEHVEWSYSYIDPIN